MDRETTPTDTETESEQNNRQKRKRRKDTSQHTETPKAKRHSSNEVGETSRHEPTNTATKTPTSKGKNKSRKWSTDNFPQLTLDKFLSKSQKRPSDSYSSDDNTKAKRPKITLSESSSFSQSQVATQQVPLEIDSHPISINTGTSSTQSQNDSAYDSNVSEAQQSSLTSQVQNEQSSSQVEGPSQTVNSNAEIPKPRKAPRRRRCRKCSACKTPDCGECVNCKDKRGARKRHKPCKMKPDCEKWNKHENETSEAKRNEDDNNEYGYALKDGYVVINTTKCTFFGSPGSGKSTLLTLMINPKAFKRNQKRHSTPVAKKAQQATTAKMISTDSSNPLGEWIEVDRSTMEAMILNSLEKHHCTISPKVGYTSVTTASEEENSEQNRAENGASSDGISIKQKLRTKLEQLRANRKRKTNVSFKEIDLIYLVDAGGQPQFQEIIPMFVRNASMNALVFKLSQMLSERPKFEYFINGREVAQPEELSLTNKELILHAAHSIFSSTFQRKLDCAESSPQHPSVMLVGMFADKECPAEKCDKKQHILESALSEYFDLNWVITTSRSKHITAIDGSGKWLGHEKETKEVFETLNSMRSAILTQSEKLKVKVPLTWFLFMLDLQEIANKRDFLSLEECYQMGEKNFMSSSSVEKALEFFDELNIILYYSASLANVVFCNPQFLLDKATDIIVSSFPEAAPKIDKYSGTRATFRKEGLLTKELLQEYKEGFDDLFSLEKLLKLLQDLLIIAKVDESTFFMPCVLPLEYPRNISTDDTEIDPLWIHFMKKHTPRGLFCAMIVHLTNSHEKQDRPSLYKWVIEPSNHRELLRKRNAIEFLLFDQDPQMPEHTDREAGRVIIVATLSEFRIHTTCAPEQCSEIRAVIESALDDAKDKLAYDSTQMDYTYGFQCQCQQHKQVAHVAKVANNYKRLKCTKDGKSVEWHANKRRTPWFTEILDALKNAPDTSALHLHMAKPDLRDLLKELNQVSSEWFQIGIFLDVPIETLRKFEHDYPKINRLLPEMLSYWLENNESAQWDDIYEALKSIDMKNLADKLRKKYSSVAFTRT